MTDFDDIRAAADKAEADDATEDAAFAAEIQDLKTQIQAVQTSLTTAQQQLASTQAAFDAYKKSHPDTIPAARFPGDPGVGKMYVGQSITGNDPSSREKIYGSPVGVSRQYVLWGQWDITFARIQRDLAAGRLPWYSMHTGADGWGPMASGAHDAEQKAFFNRLAGLNAPVIWTWDHEPVDNPEKGTPAQFCAMNRRTMGIIPKNVALVPIVQTYPFDPSQMYGGATPASFAPWFEPGSYTFAGIDSYNHRWYVPGGTTTKAPGGIYRDPTTLLSVVDKLRKDINNPDIPVGLAETGVRTDPANPGKAAQWLRDLVAQAPAKNVVIISYFDSSLNSPQGSWALDSLGNTERLDAFGPLVKAGAHLH